MDSPLTSKMEWVVPTDTPRIPTYHIMNSDNKLQDPAENISDITKDDVLKWYKNMVTGECGLLSLGAGRFQ